MRRTVLVVSAGYEPLHTVTVHHAIKMVVREVAVVEEHDGTFGTLPKPTVVRLRRYVPGSWRFQTPRWTRKRVLDRDRHTCQYCRKPAHTIDHVRAKKHGGKSEWGNTVASCWKCNNRKGDKTLKEAGMTLPHPPKPPTWEQILQHATPHGR